jgi:hypothetical protein
VQVHPSSVNYGAKKFATRWLVYHERVQTTSVGCRQYRSPRHPPPRFKFSFIE